MCAEIKLTRSELNQSRYLETVAIDLRVYPDKRLLAFEGFFLKGEYKVHPCTGTKAL